MTTTASPAEADAQGRKVGLIGKRKLSEAARAERDRSRKNSAHLQGIWGDLCREFEGDWTYVLVYGDCQVATDKDLGGLLNSVSDEERRTAILELMNTLPQVVAR